MALSQGNLATDFELLNQSGEKISLFQTLQNGPVMLVFYPGDFTPVCTQQLCDYRDQWAGFQKYELQILGISNDAPEKHSKFQSAFKLPFPLLSDPGKQVAKSFGVTSKWLLGAVSRAIVIVGRDRSILYHFVEPFAVTRRHADELLIVVKDLKEKGLI